MADKYKDFFKMTITCPACQTLLGLDANSLGRKAKCAVCGTRLMIPNCGICVPEKCEKQNVLVNENKDLIEKYSALQKKCEKFVLDNKVFQSEKAVLTTENEDLSGQNEKLVSDNKELQNQKETISAENKALIEKNSVLQKENEKLVRDYKELQNEKETISEQNETLQALLKERNDVLNAVKNDLAFQKIITINPQRSGADTPLTEINESASDSPKNTDREIPLPEYETTQYKKKNNAIVPVLPPPLPSSVSDNNRIVISFDAIVPPPLPTPPITVNSESNGYIEQAALSGKRLSPRMRRMAADAENISYRFAGFPLIKIQEKKGNPPETYIIEYFIRGIEKVEGANIKYREYHVAEFKLTGEYPRTPPKCRMLTPIFHPNIEPAVICIGDHWTAQEKLSELIIRVGEIITYQSYNIKSPLDGEAAMWADQNQELFPIDNRSLMPQENDN